MNRNEFVLLIFFQFLLLYLQNLKMDRRYFNQPEKRKRPKREKRERERERSRNIGL